MVVFKKFRYALVIKERHLDTFQHVNNATYLELLEEARWEFLAEHGIDLHSIQASQVGPVVLECHLRFLKELRLRDEIVIASQLLSFDKKIGTMQQEIFNKQGELCLSAKLIFGVFDMKARKLIMPTKEWLWAIGAEG